ncbi:MAG: hypothetical protein QOE25_489, partial [Actinomycetota bacterium]|nr:hypothetical protein [Actinomycetota bacterium]
MTTDETLDDVETGAVPATDAETEGAPSGTDPMSAARRRLWKLFAQRRMILLITLGVVVLAAAYAFLATPVYRSTSTVAVKPVGVDLNALGP